MDRDSGFGLYVHWPFCQAKCPYCDFNSHVVANIDQARWRKALVSEIERVSEETKCRTLDTIFFGGGTPSLMPAETVDAVITSARSVWHSANDMEITIEANPTSVEAGRFQEYAGAGVNRVSIGVQSLRDADLRALGRLHSVAEAREAIDVAGRIFPRFSFDLIYARQHQTQTDWRLELSEAIAIGSNHLSLYQLTIEDGTAFGDRHSRGLLPGLPDEDRSADMFDLTQELTEKAGLLAYEVSNHARMGQECRHNLIYWNSGDWAAVGPGAHGRLSVGSGRVATESISAPGSWLQSVEKCGSGELLRSPLSAEEQFEERVMMGLRVSAGIEMRCLPQEKSFIVNRLQEEQLLECAEDKLRATAKGRRVLNYLVRQLLT